MLQAQYGLMLYSRLDNSRHCCFLNGACMENVKVIMWRLGAMGSGAAEMLTEWTLAGAAAALMWQAS
jgi:hypothetical protein